MKKPAACAGVWTCFGSRVKMSERVYGSSLTPCSLSGKFVQIVYAVVAVAGGAPSVWIKAVNEVVSATEKEQKSILYDEWCAHKHIGLVHSGMDPDYRVLVHRAGKLAQQYYLVYWESNPIAPLVQRVASVKQEYTQSGGVCPFGVSLLTCGWNEEPPIFFFQSDPSGAYFAWETTAIRQNYVNGKTFLENS